MIKPTRKIMSNIIDEMKPEKKKNENLEEKRKIKQKKISLLILKRGFPVIIFSPNRPHKNSLFSLLPNLIISLTPQISVGVRLNNLQDGSYRSH